MNLSTVKWAQWDKTQSRELLVCSYVCASQCAQLLHTILYRTDLIVFPLTLQTITTAPMMSIWGKGGTRFTPGLQCHCCDIHSKRTNIQMQMYKSGPTRLLPGAVAYIYKKSAWVGILLTCTVSFLWSGTLTPGSNCVPRQALQAKNQSMRP